MAAPCYLTPLAMTAPLEEAPLPLGAPALRPGCSPTKQASAALACGSLYPVTVQVPGAGSWPKGDMYSALKEVNSVL